MFVRSALSLFAPSLFALSLFALSAACSTSSGDLPLDIDQPPQSGKADGEDNVDRFGVDEPLRSAALRQAICSEIGLSSRCASLEHTVTEVASSVRFFHKDGDPITMELTVEVDDSQTGAQFTAILTRAISKDYDLRFAVTVFGQDGGAIIAFIEQLADDAGEFPDWTSSELAARVREIDSSELPANVAATLGEVLAARAEANDEQSVGAGGAELHDEAHAIIRLGEVVGFVVTIEDIIDHPLHDGSGVHLYYDVNGNEIADTEWSG